MITEASNGAVPLVECSGIQKRFGAQLALRGVDFTVLPGEVHALMGENGAGKSTLVKVLAGQHLLDGGAIRVAGRPAQIAGSWDSQRLGFGFVHQHTALVERMSVTENIAMAGGYRRKARAFVDWKDERRRAQNILEQLEIDRDPDALISELSIAERQMVTLGRALNHGARLVFLDEITAPLVQDEIEKLFSIVRKVKADGVGFVYVSHRIPEVFALADRVTVLRDGALIATEAIGETSPHRLITQMIGREPAEATPPRVRESADGASIVIRGLSGGPVRDLDIELEAGEIVGLAGLAGAGRTSTLTTLFGVHGAYEGTVTIDGDNIEISSVGDAIKHGIAMVGEERIKTGFAPNFSIRATVTLPGFRRLSKFGWIGRPTERKLAESVIERLDVRPPRAEVPMRNLSGGNQQKVVLGRWLEHDLKLLLLDEPTHGVDIGAKQAIYALLRELASSGLPIIIASSEFEELEALCHRVVLLDGGRPVGTLDAPDITTPAILSALLSGDGHETSPHAA